MIASLLKKKMWTQTHISKQWRIPCEDGCKAANSRGSTRSLERPRTDPPYYHQEKHGSIICHFHTSGMKTCETLSFSCSKPSRLGTFLVH